jgi:hypothetical protein
MTKTVSCATFELWEVFNYESSCALEAPTNGNPDTVQTDMTDRQLIESNEEFSRPDTA